jgi:hypothetical protein
MAYHTLMAELEALEKAAPAQVPRYKEQFGAGDEVFFASMRLALQTIRPASGLPLLCENEGEANEPRDRATSHASPEPFSPHPTMISFSSAEHTASSASTGASGSRHNTHPFRQGMLRMWTGNAEEGQPGSPLAGSFERSANDLRSALRRHSTSGMGAGVGSWQSASTGVGSCRSMNSHVSFDSSVDFDKHPSRPVS